MSGEKNKLFGKRERPQNSGTETTYAKKHLSYEDELRLGPSPYLVNEEVEPKGTNFRERIKKKGRPSPTDQVFVNTNSPHLPRVTLKDNGTVEIATGEKAGLGMLFDPERMEATLSGHRLNLNFNQIDLRAVNFQIVVEHLIDLLVNNGDFMARVTGELTLNAKTFHMSSSKWLRIESPHLSFSTNTPGDEPEIPGLPGMGRKGKIDITTDQMTVAASETFLINSPDIRWGHNGILNPFGFGNLPLLRPVAKKYDKTEHFCPYVKAMVGGWISEGSDNVRTI